jgi:hypothetical protein
MKQINLLLVSLLFVVSGAFMSCTKDSTDSDATIDLVSGTGYISSDATVAVDSVFKIKWTATSTTKMDYVSIIRDEYTPETGWDEKSITSSLECEGETSITAPSEVGTYTYAIVVYDEDKNELGRIEFVITTTANITSYTAKLLNCPDQAKVKPIYIASTTGTTYSFTTGSSNSGLIDWGFYWGSTNKNTFFSLANQPSDLGYTITNWTKNDTKLAKLTGVTFADITTSKQIAAACGTISTGIVTGLAVGDIIGFKTVKNKYGLIKILTVATSALDTQSITFDVKVQN